MLRLWKFMFVSYGTLKYCVAHRYVLQSVYIYVYGQQQF